MKIRLDFVSNSSSSSYIVICTDGIETYNFNYQNIQLPAFEHGTSQFDWEVRDIYDIWSKLNFCALQLLLLKGVQDRNDEYSKKCNWNGSYYRCYNMFVDVCKDILHLDPIIVDDNKSFIDHQSCVTENANMEMFESKEQLIAFLTSRNSYIHTDNDNHG